MNYADNALEFRSGNPKPQATPDDILSGGKSSITNSALRRRSSSTSCMTTSCSTCARKRQGRRRLLHHTRQLQLPLHLCKLQRHLPRRGGHHPRGRPRLCKLHGPLHRPSASASGPARGLRGPLHVHGVLRLALGGVLLRPGRASSPLHAPLRRASPSSPTARWWTTSSTSSTRSRR